MMSSVVGEAHTPWAWVSENAAFITAISFLIHFVQADIERISLCLVKRKPTSLKVCSTKFALKMEKKKFSELVGVLYMWGCKNIGFFLCCSN